MDNSNLFSNVEISLSPTNFEIIKKVIEKVENLLKTPEYIAGKTNGVFMSYDFHIKEKGPQLIEINTNAGGGALFYTHLESLEVKNYFPGLKQYIVSMFESEWQKFNSGDMSKKLKTIAIVDENPVTQFLYSEFIIIQKILKDVGYEVFILNPKDLQFADGILTFNGIQIDLVYNRLTDFYFEKPESKVLKEAYESRRVLITPNPLHHKTFANKSNFISLSQNENLKENVPETILVTENNKIRLWNERKENFFKPISGSGSRAVYCGEKITTRVWNETIDGSYIAQKCTKASRILNSKGKEMRYDVRFFTYGGEIFFMFARLYSGQATNFRTEGGGFATVKIEDSLVADI